MALMEIRSLLSRSWIRCVAVVLLLTAFTHFEPLPTAILDLDLWWHLRGGDSIVAQHTWPHHGVFTQHVERPWVDYSWGFEVVVSALYHWFGLMGLVGLRVALEVLIAAVLLVFLHRMANSFWQAWLLTGVGMWAMHHCLNTRPMLFSIVFFATEVGLIFEARKRASVRPLWLLPPLLMLWANMHIEFFYGIVVLGLLLAVTIVQVLLPDKCAEWFHPVPRLRLQAVAAVTASSLLASIVGPYGWHLYSVLMDYARSTVPYALIMELQALNFRVPSHFVLVLTIGAAFFALGWRRTRDPYKLLLLALSTVIALRMNRDSWVGAIPALLIIGDREPDPMRERQTSWRGRFYFAIVTAAGTCMMLISVAWDQRINNNLLSRIVALNFPTHACEFIRAHSLPGPIYNDANWGGYLIWKLPDLPVAIDNRTDLYGDDLTNRFNLVQHGLADWRYDPDLNSARLVLLRRYVQLANVLYHDQRFHPVYEDYFSVVFIRGEPPLRASKEIGRPIP
ncbi:MAG: hypothetical protein JO356_17000 [Acidobacteria bacterium]|nr:hypothetical protein [Acidobacteriota bacterium]